MINELYQLSVALSKMNIVSDSWHREYKPIPNIKASAPCVRIVFGSNQIMCLESVDADLGQKLRKYGNNQGTFPAMNLAPLYRITDTEQVKILFKLLKTDGDKIDICQIKALCVYNNWGKKFSRKYKNSIQEIPAKLERMLQDEAAYEPVFRLIRAIQPFAELQALHTELERVAFELLEKRIDTTLALQILFYAGKEGKNAEDDYGSLSVILDCIDLEDDGVSSVTDRFTRDFNQALLAADIAAKGKSQTEERDAFGILFAPLEEPMPAVKLAGGFEVSLRTMFKGQPCQCRYGRIENATYPISPEMRMGIKDALTWLSDAKMKDITWVNTDKNEVLFAYPSRLPEEMLSFTSLFQARHAENQRPDFEAEAKEFMKYLTKTKTVDPENYPENIQVFMLRKLDKARTKVVYTCGVSSEDILQCSDEWQRAAKNLPMMWVRYPMTPFPLRTADIMNQIWKKDGTQKADQFNPIPHYHGMELFLGVQKQVLEKDLHFMTEGCTNMALYAGEFINSVMKYNGKNIFIPKLQDALILIGMLLYWLGSRKEDYMKEYPYLLGQILKISDSLHELYCYEIREGQIPAQLVGSSMYVAASEMPVQTLARLGKRIMPYITWAKVNKEACIKKALKNGQNEIIEFSGPTAGYLLYLFEQTTSQMTAVLKEKDRFNDYEKAQMFIGYLAAFPKKEKEDKDKQETMLGGKNNE